MNKIYIIRFEKALKVFTLFALLLIFYKGHAQNFDGSSIVGTWSADSKSTMAGISKENREIISASPEIGAKLSQGIEGRTLTFHPTGMFQQTDGSGNEVKGLWELSGNTLTIRSESGSEWIQQVLAVTNNKLLLGQASKDEFEPMIPVLHLTKNL
ncbi:lipocalin family protein [Maribacter flavus]|uniref:Lipocalin-like domain-containing protein n=1 Tax=Maribacter flavus TaxID=1658664 RepID=A0A5B2TRR5_9FLAO|nr:lipocalin family protein [Maribacter flavus]KAA2216558.1 hypothetical protein F0361_11175 [Maribacter flavus]